MIWSLISVEFESVAWSIYISVDRSITIKYDADSCHCILYIINHIIHQCDSKWFLHLLMSNIHRSKVWVCMRLFLEIYPNTWCGQPLVVGHSDTCTLDRMNDTPRNYKMSSLLRGPIMRFVTAIWFLWWESAGDCWSRTEYFVLDCRMMMMMIYFGTRRTDSFHRHWHVCVRRLWTVDRGLSWVG